MSIPKKLISFSLYGDMSIYLVGALRNVELAKSLLPDFICRFYIDDTVPVAYVNKLKEFSNVELIDMAGSELPKMTWRFLPADDANVELFLSRDTDSRISKRETLVIYTWLDTDKQFCLIKDHPVYHISPLMMGGLWGMRRSQCTFNMKEKIVNWFRGNYSNDFGLYNLDQLFLEEVIYKEALKSLAYYDDYNLNRIEGSLKIGTKRENYHFIGEAFNADNSRRPEYKALRDYEIQHSSLMGGLFVFIRNKILRLKKFG